VVEKVVHFKALHHDTSVDKPLRSECSTVICPV